MPIRILMLSAVALLVPASVHAETDGAKVTVDWNQTHQRIAGFGGSMGWIYPHPTQREKVFDLLFNDLGVSFLRIQALGGDYGDESSIEPENDNDDPAAIDWNKFKIREVENRAAVAIKAAQARGVQTILPVTWSPPAWMKTNGRRAGTGGELKPEMADEFAETWAAYCIGMKREFDIAIRDICIQNEPDLSYYYPTCRIPPDLYAKTVAAVTARLKKENLSVRVLGPDTCRIFNLPDYLAACQTAGIGEGAPILTHLYDLSIPYERVDKDPERWRDARKLAEQFKRPLWMVETANYLSHGIVPGSYEEALVWAQKIHWALVEGNCEVACYWQLFFDKKGEALIFCAKNEDEAFQITPKFYTSMNFYRFVRPGMQRCATTCDKPAILASAYKSERAHVVVLINTSAQAAAVTCPAFAAAGWRWDRYETSPENNCVKSAHAGARAELPAKSVTTFVHNSNP